MIQNIFPQEFHNEFAPELINGNSIIFFFKDDNILCKNDGEISYPLYKNIENADSEYIFLFKIDSTVFFLAKQSENIKLPNGFAFASISILRAALPKHLAFAGLTAYHLHCWYNNNKFCGRCGNILNHSKKERLLFCEKCQNQVYPKISPAIITAVIDGNRLLMAKSVYGYNKNYSLVAGFIEIGETAEEAVKREVMEEVGVKVKNVRYYKSQPWGFSGSLLLGYTAELDGSPDIRIDKNELSEAVWVERDKIQIELNNLSLTNEMIWNFKNGECGL
jgi:NAD+ diphosphatase